jgi:hypothetical protein
LQRSLSTAAFAIGIPGVPLTIAFLALFVAIRTVPDRRRFHLRPDNLPVG